MKFDQLEKANELTKLINTTEKSLLEVVKFKNKVCKDKMNFVDNNYNLCICEHKDGSGINIDILLNN